jgi:acyl dehydratase
MKFLEDIRVGDRTELGRHTFTAQEIKSFAERFDPQPFHLDEDAAARTHYGGLIASGWHTGSVCIRLLVQHRMREEEVMRARGEAVGRTGPSPGFRELKWIKPVYADDTITFASEVIETRPVQSRPDKGLVFARNTGINQDGELVFSFVSILFVDRRSGEEVAST